MIKCQNFKIRFSKGLLIKIFSNFTFEIQFFALIDPLAFEEFGVKMPPFLKTDIDFSPHFKLLFNQTFLMPSKRDAQFFFFNQSYK